MYNKPCVCGIISNLEPFYPLSDVSRKIIFTQYFKSIWKAKNKKMASEVCDGKENVFMIERATEP